MKLACYKVIRHLLFNGSDVSEAVLNTTAIKTPERYEMRIGDVWRENAKEGLTFIKGEKIFCQQSIFIKR